MIHFFEGLGIWAVAISILLNVIISILGVVPSVFLTAANIVVFGLPIGISISIAGEALGAVVSFYLYRAGIQKFKKPYKGQHTLLLKLEKARGWQAVWLIISLRILPFVPSGAVTFISAMSRVSIITFAIASTVGKIPALLIEAFSIYGILMLDTKTNIVLAGIGLGILIIWLYKNK